MTALKGDDVAESDNTTKDEGKVTTLAPISTWLHSQRSGLLHAELSEEMANLVSTVNALAREGVRKPGTLTLIITVEPSKIAGAVEISDKVSTKLPQPDKNASLFYADGTGNLSRHDPRQPQLPFNDED